jgi:hypothetical protein
MKEQLSRSGSIADALNAAASVVDLPKPEEETVTPGVAAVDV